MPASTPRLAVRWVLREEGSGLPIARVSRRGLEPEPRQGLRSECPETAILSGELARGEGRARLAIAMLVAEALAAAATAEG